jgi:hypothetical protein
MVADSCCATLEYSANHENDSCKLGSADHYTTGCYLRLREEIQTYGGAIGGVIIIFALAQVASLGKSLK